MGMNTDPTTNMSDPSEYHMNLLVWNCRGAANANFRRSLGDLISTNHPDIVVLTETRLSGDRATQTASQFPFDGFFSTETRGLFGGIWIMWRTDHVQLDISSSTEHKVHVVARVNHPNSSSWHLYAIYASPCPREREILWHNLCNVAESVNTPWVVLEDFNEVASSIEKFGGQAVNVNRVLAFNAMLDRCSLTDLGYTGPRFTWTNLRSSSSLIMERLDRVVANLSWHLLFLEAMVQYLPRTHSDHRPILLKLNPTMSTMNRPFRFESIWLSHIGFKNLVRNSWEQADFDHSKAIPLFKKNAQH
ncbi:uncharacterized protein LOC116193821 [Punica granatum]|nr:uncharacterized protein LOC116193821 [Punica granatum]